METIASSDNTVKISKAWEQFTKSQKVDPIVRPLIAGSWERCSSYGIDPYAKTDKEVLTSSELQLRIESHQNLIRAAVPFMKLLLEYCGKYAKALLSDKDGYILEILGVPEVIEICGIEKGLNLSENVIGTNTFGIVLMERVPIRVETQEHYCQFFHDWTCTAAPIFNASGNLIGVLGISVHKKMVCPQTMGMVVAAVKAIENQLQLEKVNKELKQAHDFSKAVMESIPEGLITVNQKGMITWINANGGRLMGLEPATKIGRHLNELGNALRPIKEVLNNGSFSGQEIVLENNRGRFHFTMNAQLLKNEHNDVLGAVAKFQRIKEDHCLAANKIGAKAKYTFDDLVGESAVFLQAVTMARKAACSSSTVLLQGESGTGKELFAQAIHNASKRSRGSFIALNCASIPRELISSELFGYEEGAFTGAKRGGYPGKFELASGGTIFLDEIGDMPLDLQVTLLRVLQEKQVTRLGGRKIIPIDVRVIAATHRDLTKEIIKGHFREDLYYRLNIVSINIPPLRERQSDLPVLVNHFVRKIGLHMGNPFIEISTEAIDCLSNNYWPGNVRELENALERAINLASGDRLMIEHLPENVVSANEKCLPSRFRKRKLCSLQEIEGQVIEDTLKALKGNVSQAAQALGIARRTLYNKIQQHDIHYQYD